MTVLAPKEQTLRKYGLSLIEWTALLVSQGGTCFVCKLVPKSGRLCIDHEHVRGWKKLPPEQRRTYVRGLLCWTCNHYYLARGMTRFRALNVAEYIRIYEERRGKNH